MLPFASSSGSKAVPRHHVSGYSNGYPRGNTFEISPHRYDPRAMVPAVVSQRTDGELPTARFQPRGTTPAFRRRKRLFIRIGIVLAVVGLFAVFVWPRASILSLFSLGLMSSGEDFQLETVRYYDLSNVQGTARGWEREERILLCVPLG